MEMIKKYAGILMMLTLLVGFTSCESEDETEFNLPGEWYTNEEIDFGAYTWGRGTLMTFNARNQGTIGSAGDPNYLVFEWRWIDGGYNSMELYFYGDGTPCLQTLFLSSGNGRFNGVRDALSGGI